jgi:hypothetical protein
MRFAFAAAVALLTNSSLEAQTNQNTPDLATATPIAGTWTYAATNGGSEATFTNSSNFPQLWVHCTRATRRVSISKPATVAAPQVSIWTSALTRTVPASFNPATGRLTIDLAANDPLLDALSNSRGRIGLAVGTEPALVVPAWAEPARVVEDCRG